MKCNWTIESGMGRLVRHDNATFEVEHDNGGYVHTHYLTKAQYVIWLKAHDSLEIGEDGKWHLPGKQTIGMEERDGNNL
jgi:hypothetical protein